MAGTAGIVTHITCRLTAKNQDQLRNLTLGNRIRATVTMRKTMPLIIVPLSHYSLLTLTA